MITLPEGQLSICQAECSDIDLLMSFRMEVLHHVFSVPEGKPGEALYEANRAYYCQLPRKLTLALSFGT